MNMPKNWVFTLSFEFFPWVLSFFSSSEGSILEFQIFPGIFPEAVELTDNKEFLDLTIHGYLLYNTGTYEYI